MPWKEHTKMESRKLFISHVKSGRQYFKKICNDFGISRKTGYKWWKRYQEKGEAGLKEQSRRPHHSKPETPAVMERRLLKLRGKQPKWGVRKLCYILKGQGYPEINYRTAHRILKRNDRIEVTIREPQVIHSFERSQPNTLWQMDHKAAIHLRKGTRVVPFTILDDCSRFLVGLFAQPDKGTESTWRSLWLCFQEWGLPDELLSDNDVVFRGDIGPSQIEGRLMCLGIQILHGKFYHPQTQGKVERVQRTLQTEALENRKFRTQEEVQQTLDKFRDSYNYQRPHESLHYSVPSENYLPSHRRCPNQLPVMQYAEQALLRRVSDRGIVLWKGWAFMVGRGLARKWVELREHDHLLDVYYGPYNIHRFDNLDFIHKRKPVVKTQILVKNGV